MAILLIQVATGGIFSWNNNTDIQNTDDIEAKLELYNACMDGCYIMEDMFYFMAKQANISMDYYHCMCENKCLTIHLLDGYNILGNCVDELLSVPVYKTSNINNTSVFNNTSGYTNIAKEYNSSNLKK